MFHLQIIYNFYSISVRPSWILTVCEATEGYTAQFKDELTFRKGEKIDIIIRNGNGWYVTFLVILRVEKFRYFYIEIDKFTHLYNKLL